MSIPIINGYMWVFDRLMFVRSKQVRQSLYGLCGLLALITPGTVMAETAGLWKKLSTPGHVALIRHAIAPGTGDPTTVDVNDCGTQRNLSDQGRKQAERIGARFKANGIVKARVLTSQWCRCRETATLLSLGQVQDLPILNSFFSQYENREPQTEGLRDWLHRQPLVEPVILVTHQVNITALSGVYPSSGEIVIVRRAASGGLSVVGTIRTD